MGGMVYHVRGACLESGAFRFRPGARKTGAAGSTGQVPRSQRIPIARRALEGPGACAGYSTRMRSPVGRRTQVPAGRAWSWPVLRTGMARSGLVPGALLRRASSSYLRSTGPMRGASGISGARTMSTDSIVARQRGIRLIEPCFTVPGAPRRRDDIPADRGGRSHWNHLRQAPWSSINRSPVSGCSMIVPSIGI
jgi:hypothetical protein